MGRPSSYEGQRGRLKWHRLKWLPFGGAGWERTGVVPHGLRPAFANVIYIHVHEWLERERRRAVVRLRLDGDDRCVAARQIDTRIHEILTNSELAGRPARAL